MSTLIWRVGPVLGFLLAGAVAPATDLAAAEPVPASQSAPLALTPAQLQEIQSATQPQALVDLARRFTLLRQEEAARVCVEKACLADPSLLTDSKQVSPRSWRKFWFRYRAFLRTRKLPSGDAAGRVAIAVWLYEAEERGEARRLLRAALEIDPTLESAKALAKDWRLDSGGPLQFDLTFGLTHPLLVNSFTDEGEKLEPRRGRKFMILPFAYDPAEGPLRITKNSVQVTADGTQRCTVLGMVLLIADAGSGGGAVAGAAVNPAALRLEDQPLWERLQIERKVDGLLDVATSNLTRPLSKRTTSKTRSKVGHGSPAPPEADQRPTSPASGYAAFLVDVPETVSSIEAVYEDDVHIQVETRLLEVLGRTDIAPQDQAKFVDLLAEKVLASNPLIACAALGKLDLVRQSPRGGMGTGHPGLERSDALQSRIEETLWSALGNKSAMVRQRAFTAMVNTSQPLGAASLAATQDPSRKALILALLDQIELFLNAVPSATQTEAGSPVPEAVAARPAGEPAPTGLELSSAPENVFKVLDACLAGRQPEVLQRALDIALADSSEQSILAMANLSPEGRMLLADRLNKVADPVLKAALVRLLLARQDMAVFDKVAEACRELKLVITGPTDPVLNIFSGRLAAEQSVALVQLLANADLTAIANSDVLERTLTSLVMDAQRSKPLQAALLQLAQSGFRDSYEAPLGSMRRSGSGDGKPSPFCSLLARIASMPNADAATVRSAGTVLLAAGRVREIQDRLKQIPSVADRSRLITSLGGSRELWSAEALPAFLASCLSDNDPKPALAALNALADIYKATDAKQRWRFNLAVKLGLDTASLIKWTQAPDDKLSRLAMSLLRQLAHLTQQESDQFDSLPDASARQQFLTDLERKWQEKPAGKYGCMVYVDLRPAATATTGGLPLGAESGELSKPVTSFPLVSSIVTIQTEGSIVSQVTADGRYIGMPDERGSLAPVPGQLSVDGSQLLLDGLKWAHDQKLPFVTKVDRLALSERLKCDLRRERLGLWCGEFTIGQARASERQPLLQVTSAVLLLESIADQPPPPKETSVEGQ